MNNFTRFRAYQLGMAGSLCSYAVDSNFTLIEARLNYKCAPSLEYELNQAGTPTINTLHITSWDSDHCCSSQLKEILDILKPSRIEYPGYIPDSDNGKASLQAIKRYLNYESAKGEAIDDKFINNLEEGETLKRNNILYNPMSIGENHNDNSIVKLFRYGRFTVLSLGDCESYEIAKRIMNCGIATSEVDVMILPHHGANNGFITTEFLKAINPKVAISTSDRGNQYSHPDIAVRNMLTNCKIPLFTTKDGDVLVTCGDDNICHIYNMIGANETIKNRLTFSPKTQIKS